MFLEKAAELPPLETVVKAVLLRPYDYLLSFILDPTSMPQLIALGQDIGEVLWDVVYYMCRTFAYSMHRAKLSLSHQQQFTDI